MMVEHKNIELLSRKEFLLAIIGVMMLAVGIIGGFGLGPNGFQVEIILGNVVAVDPAVTSRGSFVFERWLLVAVLVTATFTFLYWILFSYFLGLRFEEAICNSDKEIGAERALLQFIGPMAIIVVLGVFLLTHQYLANGANASYLKYATFVLLISFVIYDFCFMAIGRIHSHSRVAADMAAEGREALLRLDAPILVGFIILFVFTEHVGYLDATHQHKNLIYAFGAGAAAFKLILTVLIFTLMNYEKLCTDTGSQ